MIHRKTFKKKFVLLLIIFILILFSLLSFIIYKYISFFSAFIIHKHKITNNSTKQIINQQTYNIKLRNEMFKILSMQTHRKIISLDDVYIGYYYRYGNCLLTINKIIFYCEILQCKRIILNGCHSRFIKHIIYDKKYNLTIVPEILTKKNNKTFFWPHPYYAHLKIRPESRFDVIKEEIKRNLPSIKIDINDLYIHIRNGDVYLNPGLGIFYAQPPLCFYKKVIEFRQFNNIYIVAENNNYPIIRRLISEYKNVKYNKSPFHIDVAKLVFAYNIVGSVSSFLTSLIKLNDNLKYYWEYDIYKTATKINHLHYSVSNFKRKYIIYKMAPSEIYRKKMFIWKRTIEQLRLMINDTCPNNFTIIKPNS